MTAWPHTSVLLDEVVDAIAPVDGEVYVDATLGMGGHTEALLSAADCRVVGIDQDPQARTIATERLARFGDRFRAVAGRFGDLTRILGMLDLDGVDGIVADLGVSSLQLDSADRGFSFRFEGPVDMRMDPEGARSAAELVDTLDVDALTKIIREYGEERHARRVAQAIVKGRPFESTLALAEAIAEAIPKRGHDRIHPATRTFQALRIAVNDELGELERFLPAAVDALRPGGRLAVISFHSLEDRRVKRYLATQSGRGVEKDPYGRPTVAPRLQSRPKGVEASPSDPNPRARSARLRIAMRLP